MEWNIQEWNNRSLNLCEVSPALSEFRVFINCAVLRCVCANLCRKLQLNNLNHIRENKKIKFLLVPHFVPIFLFTNWHQFVPYCAVKQILFSYISYFVQLKKIRKIKNNNNNKHKLFCIALIEFLQVVLYCLHHQKR